MKQEILGLVLNLLALLLFGGCLSSATSGMRIHDPMHDDVVVVSNNPAFASHFKAHREASVETAEGFLRVQVRLENLERSNRRLQYRFLWLDANGMEMTAVDPLWKPLVVHGRDIVEIEGVCPIQGAANFRLDLRPL